MNSSEELSENKSEELPEYKFAEFTGEEKSEGVSEDFGPTPTSSVSKSSTQSSRSYSSILKRRSYHGESPRSATPRSTKSIRFSDKQEVRYYDKDISEDSLTAQQAPFLLRYDIEHFIFPMNQLYDGLIITGFLTHLNALKRGEGIDLSVLGYNKRDTWPGVRRSSFERLQELQLLFPTGLAAVLGEGMGDQYEVEEMEVEEEEEKESSEAKSEDVVDRYPIEEIICEGDDVSVDSCQGLMSYLEQFYVEWFEVDRLRFDEMLFVVHSEKGPIGTWNVNVNLIECGMFRVEFEGVLMVGEDTHTMYHAGWVNTKYVTTRDFRTEMQLKEDKTLTSTTRFLKLVGDDNWYQSVRENNNETTSYKRLDVENMKRTLTEPAAIILLRRLAQSGFVGKLKLRSIFINGILCPATYKVFPPKDFFFNNVLIDVVRIRRSIKCPSGDVQTANIFMTTAGQILCIQYSDSPISLKIHPKAVLDPNRPLSHDKVVPLRENYQLDPEMSKYFAMEMEKMGYLNERYLHDKPEVMEILGNLMGNILLDKPHRVVPYVKNVFLPIM